MNPTDKMNIPDSPNKKRCLIPSPHNSPGGDGKQSPLKKGKHDGLTAGGGHAQEGGDEENPPCLFSSLAELSHKEGRDKIAGAPKEATEEDISKETLREGDSLANKFAYKGHASGAKNFRHGLNDSVDQLKASASSIFNPESSHKCQHNGKDKLTEHSSVDSVSCPAGPTPATNLLVKSSSSELAANAVTSDSPTSMSSRANQSNNNLLNDARIIHPLPPRPISTQEKGSFDADNPATSISASEAAPSASVLTRMPDLHFVERSKPATAFSALSTAPRQEPKSVKHFPAQAYHATATPKPTFNARQPSPTPAICGDRPRSRNQQRTKEKNKSQPKSARFAAAGALGVYDSTNVNLTAPAIEDSKEPLSIDEIIAAQDNNPMASATAGIRLAVKATKLQESGSVGFHHAFWSDRQRVEYKSGVFIHSRMFVIADKADESGETKARPSCYLITSCGRWREWDDADIYSGNAGSPVNAKFQNAPYRVAGQRPKECLVSNLPLVGNATQGQTVIIPLRVELRAPGQTASICFEHSITLAADLQSLGDRTIQSGQLVTLESIASEETTYLKLHAKYGKFQMSAIPSLVRIEFIANESNKVKLIFPHENYTSKTLVVQIMDNHGNTATSSAGKLQDRDVVAFSIDSETDRFLNLRDKIQLAQPPVTGEYLVLQKSVTGSIRNCFRIVRSCETFASEVVFVAELVRRNFNLWYPNRSSGSPKPAQ